MMHLQVSLGEEVISFDRIAGFSAMNSDSGLSVVYSAFPVLKLEACVGAIREEYSAV
jgi:hypothetical protein